MLTTRAQCGGRTSTRCHARKVLLKKLERMADTASPLSKPCPQAPSWKFLYAWRCRSLSSTSSLISGISCSPVRRNMSILVVKRLLLPLARTPLAFLQTKAKEKSETQLRAQTGKLENVLNWFCISSFHSPSSDAQTRSRSQHSRAFDLVSFIRMDQKHDQSNQCL